MQSTIVRSKLNKCRQRTAKTVTCFAKTPAKQVTVLSAAAAGVRATNEDIEYD